MGPRSGPDHGPIVPSFWNLVPGPAVSNGYYPQYKSYFIYQATVNNCCKLSYIVTFYAVIAFIRFIHETFVGVDTTNKRLGAEEKVCIR